jgi:hypothetical protein
VTNTLAYYDTAKINAVKSFMVQAPGDKHPNFFVLAKQKSFIESDKKFAGEVHIKDIKFKDSHPSQAKALRHPV